MLLEAGRPDISPDWLLDAANTDSVQTLQLLVNHGCDLCAYANDLVRRLPATPPRE